MLKSEIQNIQKNVLAKMEKTFTEIGQEVQYGSKEDFGMDLVFTTEHYEVSVLEDSVLGIYGFYDAADDDAVHHFNMTMIITNEADPDNADLLREAINVVNNYLRKGCFVLDQTEQTIAYKDSILFRVEDTEEAIVDMIGYQLMATLDQIALWQDILVQLAEGHISYNDFEQYVHEIYGE